RLLNVPVTIGEVHVSWNQYEPELAFEHVTILDKKTQKIPVFSIRRVRLDLNIFQSLLKHQWSLGRLNMTGAQLIVHQKPADQINIEGIGDFSVTDNLTGASMEANDVVTWIFSQSQLGLDDVNVRYVPLQGIAKSFTLNRLLLRNAKTTHTLAGQIVLNQDVQTTATFSTKWRGDITDLAHISGRIYLYLERISLPQWLKQFSWKHLRVMEGLGSIKIWIDWDAGQWQAVQSEFQFYELALQSQLTQKTRVVSRLSGSVGWKRQGDVQVVSGEDILIDFPKHLWPTTSFSAILVPASHNTVALQTLHIGYFDLEDTKELALASGFLPDAIQKKLLALNPVGEVQTLTMDLRLPATDMTHISFSTEFTHLHLNAFEKLPTFTDLSGAFAWDGQQGSLTLNSHSLSFSLDSIFENSLEFDRLTGLFQWQKRADGGWNLNAKNIIASNTDMTAEGDMTLVIPVKESPTINLSGTFSMKNAGRISNYLPLKIFDPDLVHWLRSAFQNGAVSSGKAIVQGKLSDFPFENGKNGKNGKGKFEIGGTIKGLDLKYAPGWPLVENINGTLLFSGSAMTAEIESGRVLNTPIAHVRGVIPYMGDKAPQVLTIQADPINADFAQQLRFIHESPLEKTVGTNLAGLDLTGPMQLVLKLSIPLKNPEATNVRGDVTMANATLRLPTWKLTLNNLRGAFHFTEELITATNIQGTLFDESAILNISTERPTKQTSFVKVSLQSRLNITALQKWLTVPIEKFAKGSTPYYVELHLVSHEHA
ncbi:MAG TPA: DUF3971 domain-containing protein, partial [Gammaproteobacteria bacterium]|nr:DUF3971 domain-containing protein [Gammaproteobacteria bacterium]